GSARGFWPWLRMSNTTTSKSTRNRLQKLTYPSIAKPLPWLSMRRGPRGLPCRRTRSRAPSAATTSIVPGGAGTASVMPRNSQRGSAAAGVADGHAGPHILLDAVLRERVAQPVLRQGSHAGDRLRQVIGRHRHQHLVIEHAAIAPLGKARDRQARL